MTLPPTIALRINGKLVEVSASDGDFLVDALRAQGLTSVRETCGLGVCGTCTVLVDGRAVSSCLALTALCEGRDVVTSEGLVTNGVLDEVQQRFVDNGAFQCSYCVPGMVLAVRAYLDETSEPTLDGAKQSLAGNLCRCGSYPQVIEALQALVGDRSGD